MPGVSRMTKLSRRYLIAGAAASAPLPLYSRIGGPAEAQLDRKAPASDKLDPVVAKVEAWLTDRDAIDAMMLDWQDNESALCARIVGTQITLTQACRSGLPEALAMRVLDRKIKSGLKRLHRAALRIALMRATSAEGALAKVRLGVRIQGPYDWNDDYAYTLVHDGCEQLALLLSP